MNEDRRKYRRTLKRIRIVFNKTKVVFLSGPRDTAEALDISSTGVRINTRLLLERGDRVRLLMRRGDDDADLAFGGKVAWVKPVTEKTEHYTQAGIEFTRLGLRQRVLLVRLATGI